MEEENPTKRIRAEIKQAKAPNDSDISAFESLASEMRNMILKMLLRFILFKSTKNEVITRKSLLDLLNNEDKAYKSHLNAALAQVSKTLKNDFGLNLVSESQLRGLRSEKDNYYVCNSCDAPKLHEALSLYHKESAYMGFVFAASMAVFTARNHRSTLEGVYSSLRLIDQRFPETDIDYNNSSSCPVPELKDNFKGLIARMKKDGYLMERKSEENENYLELGPRFIAEMGKIRLTESYYEIVGEPVNTNIINQLKLEMEEK